MCINKIVELNKIIDSKLTINEFIDGYHGVYTRCSVTCVIHGDSLKWENPWSPTCVLLKKGANCPKCSKRYAETEAEALKNINKIIDKNLEVISFDEKYNTVNTRCIVECKNHGNGRDWGNPWMPKIKSLKKGSGCPKCAGVYKMSEEEALVLINELTNDNINVKSFINGYSGINTKCVISCKVHGQGNLWGTPWIPKYDTLKKGFSCPKCSKTYSESESEALENIKALLSANTHFIRFETPYNGVNTKCVIHCENHPDEYWVTKYKNLKVGVNCPKCINEASQLSSCLVNQKQFKMERVLYFITFKDLIKNKIFYKIGVATDKRGVKGRFKKNALDKDNVEIINYEEILTSNINALVTEYWALRHFHDKRKYMLHVLKKCNGGTECFNDDLTKIMPMKEMIKNARSSFKDILNSFHLSEFDIQKALIEFKKT